MADDNAQPEEPENVSLKDAKADNMQTEIANKENEAKVRSSFFTDNEKEVSWAWLIYTGLYWTILIWIKTIRDLNFASGSFIGWCIGFVAWLSCCYLLKEGKYPSGSTPEHADETGRYAAAFLTSTIIFEVSVLMWVLIIEDDGDVSFEAVRLGFHCIHIFWASLFFYNTFYRYHAHMATRAFFLEWFDIIWTCVVAVALKNYARGPDGELEAVHYIYFIFITVTLCGWILPMMLIKDWGEEKYSQTVSLHLLILDVVGDVPVILAVFIDGAYKDNALVFLDVFWKSFIIIRSISYYVVNLFLYKTDTKEIAMRNRAKSDPDGKIRNNKFRRRSSLAWVIFVGVYWTTFVMNRAAMDNEIAANPQYYTWFGGMIGVMCVYDTWMAGYHGTTSRGRKMVAFACTCICTDWIVLSFKVLDNGAEVGEVLMMAFHAVAVLWAIAFFYGHALKLGKKSESPINTAWISLLLEWIDIVLMYVSIAVLNGELGSCLDNGICVGYAIIASIQLYLWFFPIMFRSADSEWRLHLHMVILDSTTDLPIVIVLIAYEAYTYNAWLVVDLIFKIFMLLRTYAYHLVINLILKKVELEEKHNEQIAAAEREDDSDDMEEGPTANNETQSA